MLVSASERIACVSLLTRCQRCRLVCFVEPPSLRATDGGTHALAAGVQKSCEVKCVGTKPRVCLRYLAECVIETMRAYVVLSDKFTLFDPSHPCCLSF